MGLAARIPRKSTYADYLTWSDEERVELIDGVIYNMTPAPSTRHQDVVSELVTQLRTGLRGTPCRAFVAPFDVRLPDRQDATDDAVTTVLQPDVVVVCDRRKLDERGCCGAPDFVIEVVSPSTAAQDQIRKVSVYEHAGVREYWIVHPTDALVTIRVLGPDGRYAAPQVVEGRGSLAAAALPGLSVDLDLVFAAH